MSLIDLLRTALRSVSANKLRAALTMLGVVIGVASVIAMLALGNGARAAVDATVAIALHAIPAVCAAPAGFHAVPAALQLQRRGG